MAPKSNFCGGKHSGAVITDSESDHEELSKDYDDDDDVEDNVPLAGLG